ncbi:MAG: polymerase subunit delta, partial [Pseudomonadota bacterium]
GFNPDQRFVRYHTQATHPTKPTPPTMIYPWHQTPWQQLTRDIARLPHAVLIAGPAGGGKGQLAQTLAQRLLCERAVDHQLPCGECDACRWWLAGNHPDMRLVAPGQDDEAGDEDKPTARSSTIRIEQIRALMEFLSVGAVRGGRRVVLINPAEAMNLATANALLKLLEEPPPKTQFILVSHEPGKLLPTIRSRTQVWSIPEPSRAQSEAWLLGEGVREAARWLDFAGGMPLAAQKAAEQGEDVARFLRDIESLPRSDAVMLAAQWEAWVKPRAGGQMSLVVLSEWLQKWLFDLILVKATGSPRFFSSRREALREIAQRASFAALWGCYNALTQMRRAANHPLNPRLFLDDMLLRYTRIAA